MARVISFAINFDDPLALTGKKAFVLLSLTSRDGKVLCFGAAGFAKPLFDAFRRRGRSPGFAFTAELFIFLGILFISRGSDAIGGVWGSVVWILEVFPIYHVGKPPPGTARGEPYRSGEIALPGPSPYCGTVHSVSFGEVDISHENVCAFSVNAFGFDLGVGEF
jgi:hypothetical protein